MCVLCHIRNQLPSGKRQMKSCVLLQVAFTEEDDRREGGGSE